MQSRLSSSKSCVSAICECAWEKIQELFSTILAPVEEYDEFFDSFASLSFDDASTVPRVGCITPPVSENSGLLLLIPHLVTTTTVWNKLRSPPSISLLYRLRHVSRGWKNFVSTTQEWAALEFTKLDTPGYERFVAYWHGIHYKRTRFERFSIEMGNLNLVLSEARVPLCDCPCCVAPVLARDDELSHYAEMALDFRIVIMSGCPSRPSVCLS